MRRYYVLLALFLIVLTIRLIASHQSPGFSYDTYDLFRQSEHVLDTGKPLFDDPSSLGGRERVFNPLYGYILAFFGLFMSLELVFWIIPNIFASLTVIVVFHIVFLITKSEKISLLFSGLSGFIPIFFIGTVNNASVLTLAVPLFLLSTYYFLLTSRESKNVYKLIFSLVFLSLLDTISIALVFGLLVYLIFLKLKNFRESIRESEVILFFTMLVLWLNILVFKRAIETHQNPFIWRNLPGELTSSIYSQISFGEAIYAIGSVLIIFGLLSAYYNLFESKRKSVTLYLSLALVFTFALIFRIIEFYSGLIFLGVSLLILSSYSFQKLSELLSNFKLKYSPYVFSGLIVLVQIALFLPAFFASMSGVDSPTQRDISAMTFMQDFESAKILGQYFEGDFISYYSNQQNAIDNDFLLISNVDKFYGDAVGVFTDRFLTGALSKLTRLEVTHIFLSERYQLQTDRTSLLYEDDQCIVKIYPQQTDYEYHPKIYEVRCVLVE